MTIESSLICHHECDSVISLEQFKLVWNLAQMGQVDQLDQFKHKQSHGNVHYLI